jgi:hypothetical protein
MLKPLLRKKPCATTGEVVCAVILVGLLFGGLLAFALVAGRW